MLPSRCCLTRLQATPNALRDSNAKRTSRRAQSSTYCGYLRPRRNRNRKRPDSGTGGRANTRRSHRTRADSPRRGLTDRKANLRGPRSRPRTRHSSPRSQTGKHQADQRRDCEGVGLWFSQTDRRTYQSNDLVVTDRHVTGDDDGWRAAGSAAYMNPEQAKGKTVDKRTGISALGCVLSRCSVASVCSQAKV